MMTFTGSYRCNSIGWKSYQKWIHHLIFSFLHEKPFDLDLNLSRQFYSLTSVSFLLDTTFMMEINFMLSSNPIQWNLLVIITSAEPVNRSQSISFNCVLSNYVVNRPRRTRETSVDVVDVHTDSSSSSFSSTSSEDDKSISPFSFDSLQRLSHQTDAELHQALIELDQLYPSVDGKTTTTRRRPIDHDEDTDLLVAAALAWRSIQKDWHRLTVLYMLAVQCSRWSCTWIAFAFVSDRSSTMNRRADVAHQLLPSASWLCPCRENAIERGDREQSLLACVIRTHCWRLVSFSDSMMIENIHLSAS